MEPLADELAQFRGNLFFSMVDKDLELRVTEMRKPSEQPFLVRMSRESSQRMDVGIHGNLLSEKPDRFGSINDSPSGSALCLITDDDNMRFISPEVVLQMVLDPPRVAHSAG